MFLKDKDYLLKLLENPYQGYAYSYPHKSAYTPLNPNVDLQEIWHKENKDHLFLYLHIPFCEMRCGFCNLFTLVRPEEKLFSQYIQTLKKQALVTKTILKDFTFARYAIGGGTPTYLSLDLLQELFIIIQDILSIDTSIPASIETSPETASKAKLAFLKQQKIQRISIGIQSLLEQETHALQRRQEKKQVIQALENIKHQDFACLNIDLIYGIPGQTPDTLLQTLKEILVFSPEEIYLYPLYTRPLTGLSKVKNTENQDNRLILYQTARDFLFTQGYIQLSMRMFRKTNYQESQGVIYCCQQDGMVGLGSGARSYTQNLHYSTEYAVKRNNIKDIIIDYCQQNDFSKVNYGIFLNNAEQKRRYVIKSLLKMPGLAIKTYQKYFNSELFTDFAELTILLEEKLIFLQQDYLVLTEKGLAFSDVIGHFLISETIKTKMNYFLLK